MPQSVACECGKRFTVASETTATVVNCPACGQSVSLNGHGANKPAISFRVKKVVENRETQSSASRDELEFACPECGKQFREDARAAGRRTQCPKCDAEFTIPTSSDRPPRRTKDRQRSREGHTSPNVPPPPEMIADESSPDRQSARKTLSREEGVEAAVAAYTAGKPAVRRRAGRSMIGIGLLLLVVGGITAIIGSYYVMKGQLSAYSIGGVTAGGAGGVQLDPKLLGPVLDWRRMVDDLAQEPGARRRQPQARANPPQQILGDIAGAKESAKKQMEEQQEKLRQGQWYLLCGVITEGVGKLICFIGGIFLLAGLIGRFLRPERELGTPVSATSAGD